VAAPVRRLQRPPARPPAAAGVSEAAMDAHKLVKMANEIAAFFEAEPDRAVMLEGVAGHLQRF